MRIKFIKDEDIVNYKKMSMFIGAISCTWKCCKEAGLPCSVCQNYPWSNNEVVIIPTADIIKRYMDNPLTEAVVFGGLEPMDQFIELMEFVKEFRKVSDDDIVIYTGYNRNEIKDRAYMLSLFPNIIIKYGRYVPNSPSVYDEVLGVTLASDNQYAIKES
jgi:hypothetical protein